ncbi:MULTISPECIES: YqiA/YcfP family alpha/beta fold hydrolase [Thiorhodovibrio]|uniref:YqiA/YcfP family alpha/beta fold hydrolase n=1 Tax=Thiorhodovibrio TaxID=61593 RepID=UPI001914C7C4|nr:MULTISPECIES: YqiA/YcfP family alpha/beta fold hydrolase [Thiorhodovibrio]WPL12011.1 esterase YqiA [Thiorhodovibrio litoralis]
MIIAYLHGFASGPRSHSPKLALLRGLGHEVYCLDTQGDYRPEDYARAAESLLQTAPPLDVLVGSSLGGFWARRLGVQLGCPWVGLNPALRPSVTLAQFQGRLQRFDVAAPFDWSVEDALAYRPLETDTATMPELSAQPHHPPGLIILAEDDEVVDARETQSLATDCEVLLLAHGGHDLANTSDYAEALSQFFASIQARRPV